MFGWGCAIAAVGGVALLALAFYLGWSPDPGDAMSRNEAQMLDEIRRMEKLDV